MKILQKISIVIMVVLGLNSYSQQDPHYTQYMYNAMSINPGYTGSVKSATVTLFARMQWVGIDGAPDTQVLSYDTNLNWRGLGLGFNVVNDNIGPSSEKTFDANVSYGIRVGEEAKLAFGLKLGVRHLSMDWGKVNILDKNDANANNLSRFLPTVGAGIYYYTNKFYGGVSVPNFLSSNHYDGGKIGNERLHIFGMLGYVFDLTETIKLKPSALVKVVKGAPLSMDLSANVLLYERFYVGLAWRWDDTFSGTLGFHASKRILIAYGYDLTTSNYSPYNSGSHEVILQFKFPKIKNIISPRFF